MLLQCNTVNLSKPSDLICHSLGINFQVSKVTHGSLIFFKLFKYNLSTPVVEPLLCNVGFFYLVEPCTMLMIILFYCDNLSQTFYLFLLMLIFSHIFITKQDDYFSFYTFAILLSFSCNDSNNVILVCCY